MISILTTQFSSYDVIVIIIINTRTVRFLLSLSPNNRNWLKSSPVCRVQRYDDDYHLTSIEAAIHPRRKKHHGRQLTEAEITKIE